MSHTTEQPVLEPSNPQELRIGDICSYSFGEKNRSYSIVEIVRILDSPYEVAEVKFLDVVVDDSGNGYSMTSDGQRMTGMIDMGNSPLF